MMYLAEYESLDVENERLKAAVAELERQRDEAVNAAGEIATTLALQEAEARTLRGERNWLLADLDDEGRRLFHLLAQTAERSRAERTRRPNPPGPIELNADDLDGQHAGQAGQGGETRERFGLLPDIAHTDMPAPHESGDEPS